MQTRWLILILLSTAFSTAWAQMFCPNGFNTINLGDSLETVQKSCGKPDAQKTYKTQPFQAQEWVYFIASFPDMPGTVKSTIAFDDNGKVVNLSVNGAGLSETQIYDNKTLIQVGDTVEKIEAVCGKPAYINQTSTGNPPPKAIEITELRYQAGPTVTLIFKNGKLTQRK